VVVQPHEGCPCRSGLQYQVGYCLAFKILC
jgi:hypothetical protein